MTPAVVRAFEECPYTLPKVRDWSRVVRKGDFVTVRDGKLALYSGRKSPSLTALGEAVGWEAALLYLRECGVPVSAKYEKLARGWAFFYL